MAQTLNSVLDWITNNKEWLFSGIGITILIFSMNFIRKFFRSSTTPEKETASNVINQTINVGSIQESTPQPNAAQSNIVVNHRNKGTVNILFIDDNKVSFIPAMKKAGYALVSWIKDCDNIHCDKISLADIIFVDVNGVGTNLFPTEQGFGLAKAIKTQFPKKCVVLYSAEPHYFRKDFNILDAVLPKNSEPYEFTKIIDDWNSGAV